MNSARIMVVDDDIEMLKQVAILLENKYTVRYVIGSNNKTLDQNDILKFKDRFMAHIKDNGLLILG